MIRVLIAEDQAMVLGALAALIDIEQDIEVVGQARSGDAALEAALSLNPDVVVTDIEMPGLSGLELAAEARRRGVTARIIILTTFARPGYLRRALDAGASGYLLKDAPSHRLADAIRRPIDVRTRFAGCTPADAPSIPSWPQKRGRRRTRSPIENDRC